MKAIIAFFRRLFRGKRQLRAVLVCNKSTGPTIQTLTCNLLPKLVRHDTMEGRDFIVVPMVMLTEGVHRGSEGPMYYPPDELSKTPVVWNHKPVVVYHPEINGVGVSACDPDILTNHKVGVVMNTKWEEKTGRLKAEAWIDQARADEVDPRIMEAIQNNQIMELSTGVFVDSDGDPGVWNKEKFSGIARNYRPDHLALLPDKTGACSIKDGAGFLRNQQNSEGGFDNDGKAGPKGNTQVAGMNPPRKGGRMSQVEREHKRRMGKMMGKLAPGDPSMYEPGVAGESSNPQVNEDPTDNAAARGGFLVKESDGTTHLPTTKNGKVDHGLMGAAWAALHNGYRGNKYEGPNKSAAISKLKKLYKSEGMDLPSDNQRDSNVMSLVVRMAKKMGLLENDDELPFDYIRSQLSDKISEECGCGAEFYSGPRPWIMDVYPNFFVYEYNNQLYQLSYNTDEEGVIQLGDEDPVEVERTPPQYRPVQMSAGSENQKQTMNKEKIVSNLIANSNGNLTEADRARLMAFSEDQLKRISCVPAPATNVVPITTNAAAADDSDDDEDDDEEDTPPKGKKGKGKGKSANNEAAAPVINVAEYIQQAPGEIREILLAQHASYNEEKSRLVKKLAAVKNVGYTEDELNSKPLGELRKLANLASLSQPQQSMRQDYSGMGQVSNESSTDQEALVAPTMNFAKEETAGATK